MRGEAGKPQLSLRVNFSLIYLFLGAFPGPRLSTDTDWAVGYIALDVLAEFPALYKPCSSFSPLQLFFSLPMASASNSYFQNP